MKIRIIDPRPDGLRLAFKRRNKLSEAVFWRNCTIAILKAIGSKSAVVQRFLHHHWQVWSLQLWGTSSATSTSDEPS